MRFRYPAKNLLDTNKKNIMVSENTTFFICLFSRKINNFPFIQFLLYKQNIGEKNILSFPYIHFEKNLKHSLEKTNKLLNNITKKSKFEGFKRKNDDFYIFYSVDDDKIEHTYNKNDYLYWTSMHEIVNRQKLANLDIHYSTVEFFYTYPEFIHCHDNKNKVVDIPIVVLCDIEKNSFLEILQQYDNDKYYVENKDKINYKNKFMRLIIFDYKVKNNKIYYDKINSNILSIHN